MNGYEWGVVLLLWTAKMLGLSVKKMVGTETLMVADQ